MANVFQELYSLASQQLIGQVTPWEMRSQIISWFLFLIS